MPHISNENCETEFYCKDSRRKLRVVPQRLIEMLLTCTDTSMSTIIYESVMINYTFDLKIKEELALTLINSIENAELPYDKIKKLTTILNGNQELAELIEHLETMNISHLTSWAQAKSDDMKYFVVDFCFDKYCTKIYEGKIFSIDQVNLLPPLYQNSCACIPMYYHNFEEAQSYVKEISINNKIEQDKYKEPNAVGYIAFNFAEDKFKKYKKEDAANKQFLDMLPLLNRCFEDNISDLTKSKVYRMIGEIYLRNDNNQKAITNFENALKYNPKIGVQRLLNKLKKEN